MTFEHGRISTWRLPRFSAFEMDLRQSARTCGEKGERSVLSCCVSCVCDASASSAAAPGLQLCRAAAASAAAAGLQPLTGPRGPAGERQNSRELPPASRDRFCSQPCTSGAATGVGWPAGCAAAASGLQRGQTQNASIRAAAIEFATQLRTDMRTIVAEGQPAAVSSQR